MAIRKKITMQKPECLLDMDGVLVDFPGGLAKAFGVPFEWKTPGSMLCEENLGLDRPWYTVCDEEFWANLEPMPDALAIVELLLQYFDYARICIATSYPIKMGYDVAYLDQCYVGKMRWLKQYFPTLQTHFLMGEAKHFCASPWRWLIDDQENNVEMFRTSGGNAILLPRIWNSKYHLAPVAAKYLGQQLKGELG